MNYSRFEPLKVLVHYDSLKELSRGNLCSPKQLMVYPTNLCNLACGHCIMKDLRADGKSLSKEVFDRLVTDCVRLGIQLVNIAGGGEPMLNYHLHEFVGDLRKAGIKVSLNTNGTQLVGSLPVDYLRVSVDCATRETYMKMHGADYWEQLNINLRNYKKSGELGLAYLVTHQNGEEVEAFCEWAQQFDYDFLHVRPAYWPKYDAEIKAAMAKLDIEGLEAKYRGLNIRSDKMKDKWEGVTFSKCRATPLKAVMAADGSFLLCQDKFIKFGDYNTQTFDEIWYSDEHRRIIAENDLSTCPRCVEGPTNEIIQHCVMDDKLRIGLI